MPGEQWPKMRLGKKSAAGFKGGAAKWIVPKLVDELAGL